MNQSLKLGRIAGIDVYLHPTFFLLFLYQAIQGVYQDLDWQSMLYSFFFLVCVFVVVVLHECGHALMARHYGIQTRNITLWPIGGVASLETIPTKSKQELLISLAGPCVNLAIALIVFLILLIPTLYVEYTDWTFFFYRLLWSHSFLFEFLQVNIALAVFNLLPAFPLDGGRIFRSLLALRLHRRKATRIAAWVGQGMAVVFALAGIFYTKSPNLVLIALFVWFAAQRELKMTE